MNFQHPGTMMSRAMTLSLQHDTTVNEVRKKARDKLIKETPLSYEPKPLHTVDIGFGGTGTGHKEFTKDAEVAYQAALIYWSTLNPMYGHLSLTILKAWCTTNKIFQGDNAPLEAAWGTCSLARAAELIKHATHHPELVKGWKCIEPAFYKWIDTIMMTPLKRQDIWKWPIQGNWQFSIICARMQLAILREDEQEFKWAVQAYKQLLPKCICCGHACHISETKRDLTHAQFELGGMIQAAEMAWHQGVDIFDSRMYDIFEYHARLMLKEIPEGIRREDIHTPYGYWYEPVWEVAVAHFQGRLKKPMPKCERWLQTFRPERVAFHWGGGTLTHYLRT